MVGIHHIRSRHLSLSVLEAGAALTAVRLAGLERNLVLGFADPLDHQRVPIFAGVLVGPIANRVRDGIVQIGDRTFRMAPDAPAGAVLHSGSEGLHQQKWSVADASATSLTLQCLLADGACGLPGNRQFSATYTVSDNCFSVLLTATTDARTPVNVAAHPYWNLDGRGSITTHHLQVHADSYLPVDTDNLPTGEIAPVDGTSFDFRTAHGLTRDAGLDVNFCLARAPSARIRPAARLAGADGTTVEIETNAPGLQVYAGAHLPDLPGALHGGGDLRPFGAIALEPQLWPDAMAHRHFPSIMLEPGQTWRQETRYHLSRPETPLS